MRWLVKVLIVLTIIFSVNFLSARAAIIEPNATITASTTPVITEKVCVGQHVSAAAKVRAGIFRAAKIKFISMLQAASSTKAKFEARRLYKETIKSAQYSFEQATMAAKQECQANQPTAQNFEQKSQRRLDWLRIGLTKFSLKIKNIWQKFRQFYQGQRRTSLSVPLTLAQS